MSHHYQETEIKSEIQTVEEIPPEITHPFFEKNDLTFLAMIKPLLSLRGQKLIGFFLDFGESNETKSGSLDFNDLFRQFSSKNDNLKELLPALLSLTKYSDDKSPLNPALLTTLFSMLNTKNTKKEN